MIFRVKDFPETLRRTLALPFARGFSAPSGGGDKGMEEVKHLFPLGFAALLLRNREISTLL